MIKNWCQNWSNLDDSFFHSFIVIGFLGASVEWVKDFQIIFQYRPSPDLYGLEARALQREALICWNAFLYRDCDIEMGDISIQTNATFKQNRR